MMRMVMVVGGGGDGGGGGYILWIDMIAESLRGVFSGSDLGILKL